MTGPAQERAEASPPTSPESVDFGGLTIVFDDRVLRPREWTAAQSRWAADLMRHLPDGPVLELCAGAGHIGLLAVAGSERSLVCVDVSEVALSFAAANAQAAGMADRFSARRETITEAVEPHEAFPMIIADPPWVPRDETGRFAADPLLAIDGGDDGLDLVRDCVGVIDRHLAPGGTALLQVGPDGQATAVEQMLTGTSAARTSSTSTQPTRGPLVARETRLFGSRGALVRIDRPASQEQRPASGEHHRAR